MIARTVAVTVALLALLGSPAGADPALLARVERTAAQYHEDPKVLDPLRDEVARAAGREPRVDLLIALARVSFIWGDVRATSTDAKLDAYERGRAAAKRAVELEPKNALAHLWYAVNTGRWGQTKGVMRSLFLLSEVQKEIETVIALDPKLTPVYSLAGNVYYEVPGMLGGDLAQAEAMFRRGLEQDPVFTGMRVGLGKTLIKRGRIAEARRELERVLAETAPRSRADWTVKDMPEARRLLESIKGRS
jgi:tetratricopeptide (TPR) repeat protein